MNQQTIGKSVHVKGVGIHTGGETALFLHSAPCDRGIVFLKNGTYIKADVNFAETNRGNTVLVKNSEKIYTVEHLLASLYGMGIDNCICEVKGDEIPSLDGSAIGFVEIIKDAGIIQADMERRMGTLKMPISCKEDGREIFAFPSKGFYVSFYIDYARSYPSPQYRSFRLTPDVFEKEIAPARTYCFHSWIEDIKKRGMGMGGSLDNVIVIGEDGPLNQTPLRFPDEFVRHKTLDLIGDFSLIGSRVNCSIAAFKSGHTLNINLVKFLRKKLEAIMFDIKEIEKVVPHRYPFLLVDRIVEITDEAVVGIKNVTVNEPFFKGHFPGHPIMPGVLIVESMAQVGGFLLLKKVDNPENKVVYFLKIDKVKFRKPVIPGDVLRNELRLVKYKDGFCVMEGRAYVDDVLVCEGELTAKVMKK